MQADSQMIELQDSIKKYGLPYPYTKKGALDYINFILSSNPNDTFDAELKELEVKLTEYEKSKNSARIVYFVI